MPQVFDQMMGAMARDPAFGFANVLKDREAEAIRDTPLSAAEERRIGRTQRDAYLRRAIGRGFPLHRNDWDLAYMRALVLEMAKSMTHRARYPELDVKLVKSPVADGQSFPGGYFVFTTALLEEPDEATVAAVVAHEVAHLDLGHLNEYARRDKFAADAFAPGPAGMDPFAMMTRGMALGSIMMAPFRPEHEHEADCQAVTWLFQRGYDPIALAEFFERLHNRRRDSPDTPWSRFNRSHPYSLDRREQVLGRTTQLRNWKPDKDLGRFADELEARTIRGR